MNADRCERSRAAYTVVELSVTVAIIGAIAALVLPAIQAAREAARQLQCKSHLREIALACQQHENAQRHLPTGGWGWRWHGDPDRGFGRQQPGGWPYAVLPYIEQPALRAAGASMARAAKRAAAREMSQAPLAIMYCPSRRRAAAYPFAFAWGFANMDRPQRVARSDYAANLGDEAVSLFGPGPLTLKEGDSKNYRWPQTAFSGVVFRRSQIRTADITDGASNVYLVGEKVLRRADYTSGFVANDDQHLYVGFDRDTVRSCHYRLASDAQPRPEEKAFGSAHAKGCQMALCDGSVRFVAFNVANEVHRSYGDRRNGTAGSL